MSLRFSRLVSRGVTAMALLAVFTTAACGDDSSVVFEGDGGGGQGAATVGGAGGEMGGQGGIGGVGGGQGGELPLAPPLRNPVDMPDDELAYQSLLLMGHTPLGATTTTCSECHSINQGLMGYWRDLTDAAVASCFADTTVPSKMAAEEALACLRQKPEVATSPFSSQKLGIYAAASHLAWFDFTFDRAYDGAGADERDTFLQTVAMPKNATPPFTQGEFDIVAEWFARGLPFMEELLPDVPPPGGCVANISPSVAAHIDAMKVSGWRAVNSDNGLLMFGCNGASTPLDCLATYPLASTTAYGANWEFMPGAKLRVLRTNNYDSSYWTRSSADGRFVGHGGGPSGGSTIIDLALDSQIAVDASYDPGFFPDNSAFIFQGTNNGTGICKHGLLTSGTTSITFQEPDCGSASQIGLYQHVGAALGGGDYWAVDSSFVSDNGGLSATTSNPAAFFGNGSKVDLTPMVFNGTNFTPKSQISKATANEGDFVISKSSRLLIARVAGQGFVQNGFRLRKLDATPNGNTYSVSVPEIARYCIDGGKPDISFDERWAVLHQYVTNDNAVELGFTGPNDPGFTAYKNQGAANLYLLDLRTGLVRRITHMAAGQYALFPHFRSDGWIYFMVRTLGSSQEHVVASDAALTQEN